MMKMTKRLTALAVLGALSSIAGAEGITMYGSLDTGFRITSVRGIDGGASQTMTAMETGQFFPNMIGLKGEETLSNNLRIGFSLENRFNSDSGTFVEANRLFDNQALLMLHGDKWSVAAGRMEGLSSTMGEFDLMCPMDPFEGGWADAGGGNMFANIGLSANNAVAARIRPIDGLTVTGAYSLSIADTEKASYGDNQHYAALGTSYTNDRLWAGITYEAVTRGDVAAKMDQVVKAGINYDFGAVRAFAAYSFTKDHAWYGQTIDSNTYMLGLTAPLGNGLLRTSLQWLDGDTTQVNGKTFAPQRLVASLGYTYNLSERTMLWSVYSYSQGKKSLDKDSDPGYEMADIDSRSEANRSLLSLGVTHFF